MSCRVSILSVLACLGCATSAAPSKSDQAQFAKWAAIKTIYPGPAESIGAYDAGCLAGAAAIDHEATGFALMRLSRNRSYSHPEMNSYLHALGEKLQALKSPMMLVGDVGPPRGGPMLSGHASHQMGLDADIWLRMSKTKPTRKQRESWSAPSFVIGRKKLKKTWGLTQVNLIMAAASFDAVNRIFVSPAIKRYFCDSQPSAPWLYKIRAWWGHEEHIHVRLSCPHGAAACVSQPPLNPADNGCGTELDWWFSKEADDEWTKIVTAPKPREFPNLPAECAKMTEPDSSQVESKL